MTCEDVIRGEIVEKYLHDQLSEEFRDAFEQHYFECDRCFGLLQTCRGLQVELARTREAVLAPAPRRSWIWSWGWLPATAVVAIAVGLSILQRPIRDPVSPAGPPQPSVPPEAGLAAPQPPSPMPSLAQLARVEPPRYDPARLRGAADEATARYLEAMKRYQERDYQAAIAGLRAARDLDPDAPHIRFFLGVSQLMAAEPDAAIDSLRRTIALGDSAYTEDAHFLLAKAFLQKGDLRAAERELTRTIQLRGERQAEARQLLDQLQKLSNRR